MKALFLFLLLVSTTPVCAQSALNDLPTDSLSGRIVYQQVVLVKDTSKKELYLRAKQWAARTFVSAKDVIQLDDPEAGVLLVKAIHVAHYGNLGTNIPYSVWHTVKLEIKDGRYRYTITDFYQEGLNKFGRADPSFENQLRLASQVPGSGFKSGNPHGMYKILLDGVRETAASEITPLQAAMNSPTNNGKDF